MSAGTLWFFNLDSEWIERNLATGGVRYDIPQALDGGEKAQAVANIGAVAAASVIRTDAVQSLSDTQKKQAGANGALSLSLNTATIPTSYCGDVLTLRLPHLRQFVWNGTAYVRAPWHRVAITTFCYVSAIPVGWLEVRADAAYNEADYPDLASALGVASGGTFSLVETRGEFIRVWDHGRGVDTGRAIRTFQDGTLINAGASTAVVGRTDQDFNEDAGTVRAAIRTDIPQVVVFDYTFRKTRPRNISFPLIVSY